jgi:hypothetical protein
LFTNDLLFANNWVSILVKILLILLLLQHHELLLLLKERLKLFLIKLVQELLAEDRHLDKIGAWSCHVHHLRLLLLVLNWGRLELRVELWRLILLEGLGSDLAVLLLE